MNWKNILGYGALIWVIMFAVVSATLKLPAPVTTIVMYVVLIALAWYLIGKVKPANALAALLYGVIWASIGVSLDALVTVQFNATVFFEALYWLGYVLLVLTPFVWKLTKKEAEPTR